MKVSECTFSTDRFAIANNTSSPDKIGTCETVSYSSRLIGFDIMLIQLIKGYRRNNIKKFGQGSDASYKPQDQKFTWTMRRRMGAIKKALSILKTLSE